MRKYKDYLADKAAEAEAEANRYNECETCNCKCDEYMNLISDMRKYMTLGSFKQNTPKYMIDEYRDLMKRANHVARLLMDGEIE